MTLVVGGRVCSPFQFHAIENAVAINVRVGAVGVQLDLHSVPQLIVVCVFEDPVQIQTAGPVDQPVEDIGKVGTGEFVQYLDDLRCLAQLIVESIPGEEKAVDIIEGLLPPVVW